MKPTIAPTGEPGLSLHDPIEGAGFELLTDRPVTPTPADADRLPFPVDRAVAVEVGELVVPKLARITVRRPDGEYLDDFEPDGSERVEGGDRLLDLSSAPMLLYVHVPGPVRFTSGESEVRVSPAAPAEVVVGCRSFHERPAATVTVPREPRAAMAAVSTFGSALKTTTCERSYPTLRGHPPRVELGAELSVPAELSSPSTDVTVEVPPTMSHVFPVAPLAYYLGAEVRPGDRPVLRAGDFEYPLDAGRGFEAGVATTLQRVFLLDCVVRTEGIYQFPLAERAAVEELLPADTSLASLYDAPLADQLQAYLSLPGAAVDDLLPEWPLCVDVAAEPANLEALPYLVDDLALVRTARPPTGGAGRKAETTVPERRAAVEAAVDDFMRSDGGSAGGVASGAADDGDDATFRLPAAPAVEHAYLGPGYPLGVNKCSVSALRRRLDRAPADEPGISVRIVCNDAAMAEEDVVQEYYGLRDLVQFEVTVDYGLSTRDLRGVFASDADLLHYVGHIDGDGIACTDGKLDARTLETVGVDAFLLNACSSHRQGRALIEAGAKGGVVTNADVSNVVATAMGRTLSRALNSGFTLRSALSIADDHHATAHRYLVLGDGGAQLVQGESGIPYALAVEPVRSEEGQYRVTVEAYPSSAYGPGSTISPHVDGAGTYLPFGHLDTLVVTAGELEEFLEREIIPVSIEDQLYWSDELTGTDQL